MLDQIHNSSLSNLPQKVWTGPRIHFFKASLTVWEILDTFKSLFSGGWDGERSEDNVTPFQGLEDTLACLYPTYLNLVKPFLACPSLPNRPGLLSSSSVWWFWISWSSALSCPGEFCPVDGWGEEPEVVLDPECELASSECQEPEDEMWTLYSESPTVVVFPPCSLLVA